MVSTKSTHGQLMPAPLCMLLIKPAKFCSTFVAFTVLAPGVYSTVSAPFGPLSVCFQTGAY